MSMSTWVAYSGVSSTSRSQVYQEVAARKWASTRSGLNFSGSRKKPTSVPSRMIVSVSPSMIARATVDLQLDRARAASA